MATYQVGSGSGGNGTADCEVRNAENLNLIGRSDFSSNHLYNPNALGLVQTYTLANGTNAIAVPAGVGFFTIYPPPANSTVTLALGVSTNGISKFAPCGPIALDPLNYPANLTIIASGALAITIVWD